MLLKAIKVSALVLKIFAIGIGVFLLFFGTVIAIVNIGLDGVRPDRTPDQGFFDYNCWRFIGMFFASVGILFAIPNFIINKSKIFPTIYLIITFLLSFIVIAFAIYAGSDEADKLDFYKTMILYLIMSLFAPLSLIFSMLAKKKAKIGNT
ncbi:MAG: hypothetical protein JSU85_00455 [Candidatus Zixiibacteriota bacterium]|nr:MAG: hypothetical protein JSU85_00455 [candidate division Zixibacteria bacterium]